MVGGVVTSTRNLKTHVWVLVQGTGTESGSYMAIYLFNSANAFLVQSGDQIWVQGKYAYWTPANGAGVDIQIPRLL